MIVKGSERNQKLLLLESFSDILNDSKHAPPNFALELVELLSRLLDECYLADDEYQLEMICHVFDIISTVLDLQTQGDEQLALAKIEVVRYLLSLNVIETLSKLLMVADGSSILSSTYHLFLENSIRLVCHVFAPAQMYASISHNV
jgi:hypothetical protein